MAERMCIVEGCERLTSRKSARGMCPLHYDRWRRPRTTKVRARIEQCTVEGCGRPHAAKGLCAMHYYRLQRTGSIGGAERLRTGPKRVPLEQRFWDKVVKTETCWLWTGMTMRGYGYIGSGGASDAGNGQLLVHRVAYEMLVGPIPKGLTIDHLCYTQNCVNPDHLEPVTQSENTRRAAERRRRLREAG